jgi:hypothetical protein
MARFVFEDEAPAPAARFVFEDEPAPASVGRGESFVRGAVQGATVNLSDDLVGKTAEAGARLQAQTDASMPLVVPGPRALAKTYPGLPYPEAQARWRQDELARRGYADLDAAAQGQNRAFLDPAHAARGREVRDAERARNDAAYEANKGDYILGSVVGSTPVAIATGGAGATRQGAGLGARVLSGAKAAAPVGAVYGAGGSEADSVGGVVRDAAVGGAGAALFAGAVPAAGAVARRLTAPIARKGAAMVTKGTQRAQQQAAEESAQAVASLEGAARERAANAYRQMERIDSALKTPAAKAATDLPEGNYLYHVTPAENAEAINLQGLRADAPKIAEGGPHGNTRAVFLAENDTVPTYRNLYGEEGTTVYRVPRSAVSGLEEDLASEGRAWMTKGNISPELLEVFRNNGWVPARYAALEDFTRTPEYAALVAANAKGILAAAPGAAAEREAAAVIAAQARQDLPQAIQSRTGELLTPQARADAASFLKAYAEPAVWALGAQQAASALGMDPGTQAILAGAAGMIGGRTRAGKALANRLTRPAHQVAVGNALRRIGSPPAVPPSATQTAAIGLDSELAALINAWRGRPGFAPAAAAEEDQ